MTMPKKAIKSGLMGEVLPWHLSIGLCRLQPADWWRFVDGVTTLEMEKAVQILRHHESKRRKAKYAQ